MKDYLRTTISKNIKTLRERKNMSQSALAQEVGVSKGFIGSIETAQKHPSVTVLEKIAEALEVPPYRLFQTDSDILEVCDPQVLEELKAKMRESVDEALKKTLDSLTSGQNPESAEDLEGKSDEIGAKESGKRK